MDELLNLSREERNRLIINTSMKMNMAQAIIEKDFWVCFILNYLFTSFKYKDFICFKGGTSLSKVYHCINRFSEDIDLALDWAVLGLTKDEVYSPRSNRQQDIFNKAANEKTGQYLKNVWLPLMKTDIAKLLNEEFRLFVDDNDPQTLCFQYPRSYEASSILQVVRLEIGALAEPVPIQRKSIQTYIAQCYPAVFKEAQIFVNAVDILRTFFEKVTILHREANRMNGHYPSRYSRHYYDLYQMIKQGYDKQAIGNIQILKSVVNFKNKFYTCNWAHYDDVLQGKCKLVPDDISQEVFSKDYDMMKNMFFLDYPTFEEIINVLNDFENILNIAIKQEEQVVT